uniref:Dephospho-CoA kinase n=1 Tax=candidate division WOR-3 bacterium TaxID=2052148 RepID=A0A7C3UXK1_UNCW3
MIRIGITGNIGAGKTTVGKIFQSFGASFFDADKIGHEILSHKNAKEKLLKSFGKEILTRKGEIDRKKLAQKAFQSPQRQKIINRLTHPLIIKEIIRRTKGKGVAVIEASLLFESSLAERMDYIIWVSAPRKLKLKRAEKKYPDAEKRLLLQLKEGEGKRRADFVLENKGSLSLLKKKALLIWERIVKSIPPQSLPPDIQKASASL